MTLVGNEAEAQALVAETEIVGIIGASLTGVLFLITSWRLIFHSWGCCDCRFPDRQHAAFISEGAHQMDTGFLGGGIPGGLTMRRAYHVLLWYAAARIFEGITVIYPRIGCCACVQSMKVDSECSDTTALKIESPPLDVCT